MSIAAAGVGPPAMGQSTLELLADPKKLDKTLKSLQTAQERAQKAIDLAGPAEEILAIRADVALLKESAVEAKSQALEDAEAIVEEGNVQAQLMVDKAVQEGNRIKQEAEDEAENTKKIIASKENAIAAVELKLDQRMAELQKDEDALDQREADLDNVKAELDVRASDLDTLNDSLLKEKTRLTGVREQIDAALG